MCLGGPAESMATSGTIPEADEEPRSSEQQEPAPREACPSDQWRRLQSQALPDLAPEEPGGSGAPSGMAQAPAAVSRAV